MSLTKYASLEQAEVLDIKGSPRHSRTANFTSLADFDNYRTGDGYLYARIRAISSRTNRNHDGWPSVELAGSPEIFDRHHSSTGFTVEAAEGSDEFGFATFVGKPIFVDHHNSDPKKARGVIVDAKLNVLDHKTASGDSYWSSSNVDPEHLPPTEVELLLEVDANSFPRLAQAIVSGDLDGFSMGCFVEGTPITLNDGTQKPIEKIHVGDEVLTHTGEIERVTSTITRHYEGDIYHVETFGQAQTMTLTPEHPVWVAHAGEVEHEWVEAHNLQVGDYVLTPRFRTTLGGDNGDYSWARLIGFYLAEGNLGYDRKRYPDGRPVFVEWNFNVDEEDYIQSVKRDLGRLGYTACGPYMKNNCATVRCNSPELAASCLATAGQHSWGKKLAPHVLDWATGNQRALLDAYFKGDGHVRKQGRVEIGTASSDLAHQIFALATRVGYRMTPPTKQHSPSAAKKRPKYSMYIETAPQSASPDHWRGFIDPEGVWRKITKVSSEHFDGSVYNFDVQGPDSYVAADIAVHNCDVRESKCSHCGHIATNPEEYCSHILMKGAHHDFKTADGKRVSRKSYENCYGIQFFEISAVFDPADETALAREVRSAVYKEADVWNNEFATMPDPVRPRENEVETLAEQYVQKGIAPDQALDMAERKIHGTPAGHGEGFSVGNYPKQWMYNKLPDQFPPAIRGEETSEYPFAQDAFDALNETWPNRPRMNNPLLSHTKTAENPLPQEFMIRAPDEVDTLRDEQLCPICFAPGTLVRTARGTVPIETIEKGELVLTSSGAFKPVLQRMERQYDGDLIEIDVGVASEPILTTPNHPFKILWAHHQGNCRPGWCDKSARFENRHSLEWSCAEHLTTDSYLVVNVPAPEVYRDLTEVAIPSEYTGKRSRHGADALPLTDEMLWALGMYLAEGSAGKREITFSLHRDEIGYQTRICSVFESLGYTTRVTRRENKPNSMWVHVHSSTLAEWFPAWLGKGCANKQIPGELLNLPVHRLQWLLTGVLDGDGCEGTDTLKQTSSVLATQVIEISRRLKGQYLATVSREHLLGKKIAYIIPNAGGTGVHKVRDAQRVVRFGHGKWALGDRQLQRIRNINRISYSGPVYNLEIQDDPTYTVQNVLVHNCGNDMDSETCQVCGYVSPPKEFDNPDLDKAMEIRNEMKQREEQQATQPETAPGGQLGQPGQGPPGGAAPGGGGGAPGGGMTTKAPATAKLKSDMRWTPKVHPKTAARINQIENSVTPANSPATDEPKSVTVTKDQTKPVTSAMQTAQQLITNAKRNHGEPMNTRTADGPTPPGDTSPAQRVDVMGVGGVMDASNEEASKSNNQHGHNDHDNFAQVDLLGVGTTGTSDVSADKTESLPTAGRDSMDSGFNTDKIIESIPTKTFPDKDGEHPGVTDPVTRETLEQQDQQGGSKGPVSHVLAYDDNTLEQGAQQGDPIAQGGSAVQGVQPADSVATPSYKRVNVLEHMTSPSNNSGETKTWSGTDGNGVLKQQEPVTSELPQWGGVTVPDVQLHTTGKVSIAALRLAEAEVELGLLPREQKWVRMAELDAEHPAKVQAQLETLARVKTAGLNKLAQHRQASRLPRAFGKNTSAPNGFERIASDEPQAEREPITDESLDAGLFLR